MQGLFAQRNGPEDIQDNNYIHVQPVSVRKDPVGRQKWRISLLPSFSMNPSLIPSELSKLHASTYHLSGVAMQKRVAAFRRQAPRWTGTDARKLAEQTVRRLYRNA